MTFWRLYYHLTWATKNREPLIQPEMEATAYFQWQRGYGALTLGEKQRAAAIEYVRRQKQHHQQQTTNAWLERVDEFDEGPADHGIVVEYVPVELRERVGPYEVLGEPPF